MRAVTVYRVDYARDCAVGKFEYTTDLRMLVAGRVSVMYPQSPTG